MKTHTKSPLASKTNFYHPKYWGIWFAVALLYLFSLLPLKWRFSLGRALGRLMFKLAKSRRQLVLANLELAFPNKTKHQKQLIAREHFESLGIQLAEMTITSWGHHRKNFAQAHEKEMVTFIGLEHLEKAQLDRKGAIMLTPHFTHIEMTSLFFSFLYPLHPVYRPHDNPLVDHLILTSRTFNNQAAPISYKDTRTMIRLLKKGEKLGYLPDQRYRGKGHVVVPFFNHAAKSHTATSKLAKLTGCPVIPTFTRRKGMHYEVEFLAPLDNFPSGDDRADTQRLHQIYEEEINKNPAQYLWVHNRWDLEKNKQGNYQVPSA